VPVGSAAGESDGAIGKRVFFTGKYPGGRHDSRPADGAAYSPQRLHLLIFSEKIRKTLKVTF
jgi:hypothetical protein